MTIEATYAATDGRPRRTAPVQRPAIPSRSTGPAPGRAAGTAHARTPPPSAVVLNRPAQAGDILYLDREASVQFAGRCAIRFQVIRPLDISTYEGWIWLKGYQLNAAGDAVEVREVWVQKAGIKVIDSPFAGRPR